MRDTKRAGTIAAEELLHTPLHMHDNNQQWRPQRLLRGVLPWGEVTLLLPVTYQVEPSGEQWASDDFRLDIEHNRILTVTQHDGIPVKFYNSFLWESIKQYVRPEPMGSWRLPARLMLMSQAEIDRWDKVKGEVTPIEPPPVAPPGPGA